MLPEEQLPAFRGISPARNESIWSIPGMAEGHLYGGLQESWSFLWRLRYFDVLDIGPKTIDDLVEWGISREAAAEVLQNYCGEFHFPLSDYVGYVIEEMNGLGSFWEPLKDGRPFDKPLNEPFLSSIHGEHGKAPSEVKNLALLPHSSERYRGKRKS